MDYPEAGGPYTPPAECAQASAAAATPRDVDTARSMLVGRWRACGDSVFGITDSIGLELAPDGHFYQLYTDAAGEGYRGLDREGNYELLDSGESVQLNLNVAGGGTMYLHGFGSSPRSIALDNLGVTGGRYVFSE